MKQINLQKSYFGRITQILSVGLIVCLLAGSIKAAPGDLDPTFDSDGKVTTAVSTGNDAALAVAVQSDGKIVAVGYSGQVDFAVARYNADGSLDTSFDGDRKVAINFNGNDFGGALALQGDGKIVVAGVVGIGVGGFDFAVVRLLNDNAPTPTPTPGGGFCVPTTTVTEGDLAPGGIASFGVSSGQNFVTVDHVNAETGLQSLTVVGTPTNAIVNIPPFTPGTLNPVTVTFNAAAPGLAVDFTLRAASTFHAAFIRVRCAETCTPTTTVTEGDLASGGIVSFGVTSGAGSVTVDHVNAGTGLQSLTLVGTPTNAVVNIPAFTPGTFNPVVVTFSVIDPTQPVDFTLRAASTFHAANIRARCVTVRQPKKPEN